MKLLFLDIDGVLNHQDFYEEMSLDANGNESMEAYLKWRDETPYPLSEFDPKAVKRVNETLGATGAKLVVSSSWRLSPKNELQHIFEHVGLPTEFDVTPNLVMITRIDMAEIPCRGDEIKKFMEGKDVESYVILDDDEDMLPEQMDNFVHCDFFHGYTEDDKIKAIEILNRKKD